MGRIVICEECGYVNDMDTALVKSCADFIKLFVCERCGNIFFKLDYQLDEETKRIREKSNSELRESLEELEIEMEGWGEEDKKLKVFGEILLKIGKKTLGNS